MLRNAIYLTTYIHCDNARELEYFVSMLSNVTEEYLSFWFCDIYIRRCASQHPHIASSFDSISSLTDLQRVITAVSNERQRGLNEICLNDFVQVQIDLQHLLWRESWNIRSNDTIVVQLQLIDSRSIDFYRALCLLRCVNVGARPFYSCNCRSHFANTMQTIATRSFLYQHFEYKYVSFS